MTSDFGFLLDKYRTAAGFSTYALARESGTPQTTVAHAQRGIRPPPPKSADKWAKALGIKGDDLAEFMRAAQRARAYSNVAARPELDALNAELAAAKEVLGLFAPLLDVPDAIKAELHRLFNHQNTLAGLLAARRILKERK